jgi:excinuclease ABC subunit C
MDLTEKIRTIPLRPGVYLYKNAEGEVIYVGKAKNLRARVRSYFQEGVGEANAKTGSLLREAVDVDYIVVDNNKEALALENNLIKQKKPRFNILLRDDKTYPYIKLTLSERFPRVYVTRRLRKDGSNYYGPYFPGNLAYRIVDLIHRSFLVPSCKVDLTRYHLRPCLQFYIKRCLGPCVQDLTTPQAYLEAVHDVQLLLEGRQTDLAKSLRVRMDEAARQQEYERAARYRDMISTVAQLQEKQRMAAAEGDDQDVFGYHYENDMLAVNVFHLRGGKILDRREFFWDELPETSAPQEAGAQQPPAASALSTAEGGHGPQTSLFHPGEFFSALMKQVYIDQQYVPRNILAPVDFEDRTELEELLSEKRGSKVEILVPQRGEKRSLIDLAAQNAKQSFDQRFRVMKPQAKAVQEALQDALGLPDPPKRIECFDISHIQGSETVASMVVWEDGKMNKSEYRKFIVRTAIAKKEEIIYVFGQEDDPVVLDRHSPVLHLVQMVRDESHRFAVTFHRKRRQMRDRKSELLEIPGVGELTRQRLLQHFGSVRAVQQADAAALGAVLTKSQTEAVLRHFQTESAPD